ncbi:MAG: LTA synthase family protein [Clostridiales bacterium]|nr:LTA synthase family protein [Clostridiales bacterium]
MISVNKLWKVASASVITLALWTFISVNTSLFVFEDEFCTFEYIMSYVVTAAVWALISLKFNFDKITERILGIFVTAVTPFLCMQISMMFAGLAEYTIGIYFQNILIYLALMALMFALSRSTRFAAIATLIISFTFNIVSFILNLLRGSPLIPSDFLAVGTAMQVAEQYSFTMQYQIVLGTVLTVFAVVLVFKFPLKMSFKHYKLICPAAGLVLCFGIMLGFSAGDYSGVNIDIFDQYHANNTHGTALSFYINVRKMRLEKPEGYDAQACKELLSKPAENVDKSKLPNILVVMNESLTDMSKIGDFKTDYEYLPYINSLKKNTIRGDLLVSPFGGYTCNSEFEFLTGISMAMMPTGSAPYLQFMSKSEPYSLTNYLNGLGYQTEALHPYYARCWNRDKVYGLLGFNNFISLDNLDKYYPASDFEYVRCYISDRTSYNAAISRFENKKPNVPMFIFNITMQNHGGYNYYLGGWENIVHITDMKGDYPQAEQYLSLVRESDKAFKELVEYFEDFEEPTIILLFGDHDPAVETEFYEELMGKSLGSFTTEEMLARYKVPFVLWANFDIAAQDNVQISMNYLQNLLLETAGLPKNGMNKFLDEVKAKYPLMNATGYYDNTGVWHNSDEKGDELLNRYRQLNYYILTDKKKD